MSSDVRERVQAAIDQRVSRGVEVGLQVAVIERGRLCVDVVSGLADRRRGLAVAPKTLFYAASTAKGVASSVAHVLVARGELAYNMRAVDVWPAVRPDADFANRRDVLTSDIPSGGTMTARGVARVYAALLGHVDGVDLVSPGRLKDMAAVKFEGTDEVMAMPTAWAFGFGPQRPGGVPSRPGSTFGMVGMNGSAAYADIDSGVAVAVMRNRFAAPDLTAVTEVDRIVADAFPAPRHLSASKD